MMIAFTGGQSVLGGTNVPMQREGGRERERNCFVFFLCHCAFYQRYSHYEYYKFAYLYAVANAKYRLQYFIITFQYTYTDVLVTLLLDFAISIQKIYSPLHYQSLL